MEEVCSFGICPTHGEVKHVFESCPHCNATVKLHRKDGSAVYPCQEKKEGAYYARF